MRCPGCGQENPAGAKFCLACGARVPPACSGCGNPLPAGARFCVECGRPVGSSDPAVASGGPPAPGVAGGDGPSAPATRSPEAYTPRHLAEKILASRSAVEGERKAVTVLFCDLVSSTALAERLGPEGMHALLNQVFDRAVAEVHRYEGTVNQFLGDGFMALFGAPVAHEDHARRAVLAALGVRRALAEQPPEVEPGHPEPVVVRMGLHTGQVVVGAIGDNLRMDYTAVGDTTHLAARLQQMAEPGAILVSEATARLVRGYAELEPLGPVTVRGRAEPVSVCRVVAPGSRRSPLEGADAAALTPFVGRTREMGALRDLLQEMEACRGQAVGLVGEPGVGKSRLLLELRQDLARRPVTLVEGRCLSFGSAIPYLPVLDLVRGLTGLVEIDAPPAVAEKLRSALAAVDLDREGDLPYLLYLCGIKAGAERVASLGPEIIKARTFETVRQLVLRSSRRAPLVLALEDLHWVDSTSEDLLTSLVERLADAPVMVLATYRPGYRPPWIDRSYATQLSLSRLSPPASLSVLRAVRPGTDPEDPVARLILDKAEGNPFFLEELARAVATGGGRPGLTVPDTVQGVLAARIDRLPEPAKRVLQTAAVLGREFSRRLLGAVWDGEDLEPHLRELRHQEFVHERAGSDGPTFVFKHALTQDVAEGTLLAPRRRDLHRRAAEALRRVHPGRGRELAPVLAHHLLAAEAWADAAVEAGRAGELATQAHATREALERYDQALGAAERGGLGAGVRLGLLERRAAVHAVLGAFEPARADLETALALAADPEVPAAPAARGRLLGALAALWGGHRDYPRGLALARESVEVSEASGDRRVLADALVRMGVMLLNVARMAESRSCLERALDLFRELEDEPGQARTLDALGMVTVLAGDVDGGIAYAEEAVGRLERLGDPETQASAMAVVGYGLGYQGDWRRAEGYVRRALALTEAIGARAQEAFIHVSSSECREPFGHWGAALREAERGLALARALGHREWITLGLSTAGRLHRDLGDAPGALRLHEEQLATARELGSVIWIADALAEMGQDLVAAGDPAAGRTRIEEALRTATDAPKFVVRGPLALIDVALREGRAAEALEAARRFCRDYAAFRVFAADARRAEGEALAALGDLAAAEALLRETKAQAARLGAAPPGWRTCLALAALLDRLGRAPEAVAERAEAMMLLDAVAADLPPDLRLVFEATEAYRLARPSGGRSS